MPRILTSPVHQHLCFWSVGYKPVMVPSRCRETIEKVNKFRVFSDNFSPTSGKTGFRRFANIPICSRLRVAPTWWLGAFGGSWVASVYCVVSHSYNGALYGRVIMPYSLVVISTARTHIVESYMLLVDYESGNSLGPFYSHGLTLIATLKSYHIPSKIWDEINHPFPNFNGYTVEIWEWKSNFIPHILMDVIFYPCCD